MPRLPMYEQQTRPSGAEMSPRAAGAGIGEAMIAGGDALAQVGANIQRRADVIEQVRRYGEFETEAISMFEATVAGEDISNPEVVSNYQQALRQKMDQTLNNFSGTRASRDALRAQLENAVTQQTKGMMAAQIKAQNEMIGRTVESRFNEIGRRTFDAPSLLIDGMVDIERTIAEFAPALPAGSEQILRQQGRAQLATQAINGFIARGDLDGAEAVMKDPTFQKELDAETYRKLRVGVTAERGKVDAEQRKIQRNIATIESLAGRRLTPEEAMRIPPDLPDAVSKIAAYELVTGQRAPQSVVDRMFNAVGSDGGGAAFGNSLRGRSLGIVNEGLTSYSMGSMSPDQARQFEMAAAEAYSPIERFDPITQRWTTYQPTVPPTVREALARGSNFYGPSAGARQRVPGASAALDTPRPGSMSAGPSDFEEIPGQPDFAEAESAPRGPMVSQGPSSAAPAEQGRVATVWERRKNIAGPVAGTEARVFGIPGVGPLATGTVRSPEESRQVEADRTFVDNASRDLVRVLQSNPRFSEGERQAIEREISIGPEFFRSLPSYEGRLMGVSESLRKRREDAVRIMETEQGDAELRKWAASTIPQIDNFLQNLGLPLLITDPSQLQGLPPGTLIMDKQGREFRTR